jgi:hypothetical protein
MAVVRRITQDRIKCALKRLGFEPFVKDGNTYVLEIGLSVFYIHSYCIELVGTYNLSFLYSDIKRIIVYKTNNLLNFNFELNNGELIAYGLLLKRSVSNLNKNLLKNGIK